VGATELATDQNPIISVLCANVPLSGGQIEEVILGVPEQTGDDDIDRLKAR
jgi:hypothetical protein